MISDYRADVETSLSLAKVLMLMLIMIMIMMLMLGLLYIYVDKVNKSKIGEVKSQISSHQYQIKT